MELDWVRECTLESRMQKCNHVENIKVVEVLQTGLMPIWTPRDWWHVLGIVPVNIFQSILYSWTHLCMNPLPIMFVKVWWPEPLSTWRGKTKV